MFRILLFILLTQFSFQNVLADVFDNAALFKRENVEIANKKLSEIHAKFGKELVFETFPEIGNINSSEFAIQKARERKVNGVYVLVAKKEKKIEIKVGNKTKEIFGGFESSTLKEKLASDFKTGNFDNGLKTSVDYFSQVISSGSEHRTADTHPVHAKPYNSTKTDGGFSGIFMILLFAVLGFIIFRIIRNLMNRGQQNTYGQQPGMLGGGTGMMGGILGGIFGAMAGSWIYDKLTGRDSLYGSERHSDHYQHDNESSSSWSSADDGSDYSSGDSGSFDSDFGGDSGGDW